MQVNELPPAESARMREKLAKVNASIGEGVGAALWSETQTALVQMRAK